MDPELGKDLVSLGMIQKLSVDGPKVSFDLVLTTPACPMKRRLEEASREAAMSVPGVSEVDINVTANVRGHRAGGERVNLVPTVKNAIAVASGKGGVGKSTVAVNLAIALSQAGAKTGLMDCDVYGPSVPMMMGTHSRPEAEAGKVLPVERYNVKMMSLGFLMEQDDPVIWRGPMVAKALQQLLKDVSWGDLDYLVMDMPPGTGDAQLTVTQSVPLTGAVVVSTPQDVALIDAAKAVGMFRKVNVPVLGIIENMSYFLCPHCGERTDVFRHGGAERESKRLNVPFLGEIPIDAGISDGGDKGVPVVAGSRDSKIAEVFRSVACAVAAGISVAYHG